MVKNLLSIVGDCLKVNYLSKDVHDFYNYHRTVVNSFVENKYEKDIRLKQIRKRELSERLCVGGFRTAFDCIGLLGLGKYCLSDGDTNAYAAIIGLISVAFARIVPKKFTELYNKDERPEAQRETDMILFSQKQDKNISEMINKKDEKEKNYLESERERYGEDDEDNNHDK